MLPKRKEDLKKIPEKLFYIEDLIIYLTRLNNSIMVYVRKIYTDTKSGNKIYEMSNGSSYSNLGNGEWIIV